mmetsp:Transcript_31911/g.78278  ORF Transcript_31911/g.78278 Transcript_31911/m.78278 type:complete len:176 (+) Transcript_31911:1009-1536(+)
MKATGRGTTKKTIGMENNQATVDAARMVWVMSEEHIFNAVGKRDLRHHAKPTLGVSAVEAENFGAASLRQFIPSVAAGRRVDLATICDLTRHAGGATRLPGVLPQVLERWRQVRRARPRPHHGRHLRQHRCRRGAQGADPGADPRSEEARVPGQLDNLPVTCVPGAPTWEVLHGL